MVFGDVEQNVLFFLILFGDVCGSRCNSLWNALKDTSHSLKCGEILAK